MKRVFSKYFIAIIVFAVTVGFSACSSDDDDDNLPDPAKGGIYKVEIAFSGDYQNCFKQASITGIATEGTSSVDIKDGSGKVLTTTSLTDNNYTFTANNTFTLSQSCSSLILGISVSSYVDNKPATIKVKVHKDTKVIYEVEETVLATKSFQLSKILE
ncbi:MAG: hypothetical protein LBV71_15335 [Prevotella sp.]|jgi:hypothetical protein|nr:hypothetical protein [Prevotella sp.]